MYSMGGPVVLFPPIDAIWRDAMNENKQKPQHQKIFKI
jgi:hypothetical protein